MKAERTVNALNLTAAELDVISKMAAGKKAVEIAKTSQVTQSVISQCLKNARRASGARTNYQLLAMAFKEGLINDPS